MKVLSWVMKHGVGGGAGAAGAAGGLHVPEY